MSWGHILDDIAAENEERIVDDLDQLYDALLLLLALVALVAVIAFALITR